MTLFLAQVMPQLDGMDVSKLCDGGQYLSFTVPSHLHIILVTTSGPIVLSAVENPYHQKEEVELASTDQAEAIPR